MAEEKGMYDYGCTGKLTMIFTITHFYKPDSKSHVSPVTVSNLTFRFHRATNESTKILT